MEIESVFNDYLFILDLPLESQGKALNLSLDQNSTFIDCVGSRLRLCRLLNYEQLHSKAYSSHCRDKRLFRLGTIYR
jgi:hypothetical protein